MLTHRRRRKRRSVACRKASGQGPCHVLLASLSSIVAAYEDWDKKKKNAGTEQFRYLVRTMHEVETMLTGGEKTLKDFQGQVRNWQNSVKERDAVHVYESTCEKMQQRLRDLRGDTRPKHLEKMYSPDGKMIGDLNTMVLAMQVWIKQETEFTQAANIIQDRLIFGATKLTSLLDLRSRWVFALSSADALVKQWRRAFDREQDAVKVEKAEQERRRVKAARTEQRATPSAPPAEERCQAIKAWPGQEGVPGAILLSANEIVFRIEDPGDGWYMYKVRRESDETVGLVPTKRLRSAPLPSSPPPEEEDEPGSDAAPRPPPPAVSDDEEEQEAVEQAQAADAEEEARFVDAVHAQELAHMEADAAECGYDGD